jgi:hypothetical protein
MSGARVAKLGVLIFCASVIGCGNKAGPSTSNSAETCQNSICPQGAGAYKFCTAAHASSCRYIGSDGTAYNCASCSDCGAAVQSINSWCAAQASGGDCNSCSGSAQSTGGACSAQVTACTSDSGCATLATCLQGCSDATCRGNCNSAAPPASQTLLNNILSCVCSSCSTQCASECGGGGTTGTNGGTTGTNGGGTTGGGGDCNTCQGTVLNSGGACDSSYNACVMDTACNNLIGCLNNCAQGDTACEQTCANTAGQAGLDKFNAIGTCICNSCTSECAAQCGSSGGTTGGGTTGGGTTGGGTTGGGTTGGGTTGGGTTGGGTTGGGTTGGGDPVQVCAMCEDSAFAGQCKTVVDTCNASPACVDSFNCTNSCTYGDTTCLSACIAGRSTTTKNKLFAAIDCICTMACTSECGTVLPACTP